MDSVQAVAALKAALADHEAKAKPATWSSSEDDGSDDGASSAAAPPPPAAGSKSDLPFALPQSAADYKAAFKEIKEVGRGRFGTVLLISEIASGARYAMKKTRFGLSGQMTADKVEVEANTLARLQHPNIIRCYGTFVEIDDHQNHVMNMLLEWAGSGDLATLLASKWWDASRLGHHQLPEELIMDWFVQIAAGLAHAHSMRVLHRDLKPENVFVSLDAICKIGDFGISRVLEDTAELAKTSVGTPVYLSPEIVQGSPYSFKTDVWSLGVMLVGGAPADARTSLVVAPLRCRPCRQPPC